MRILRLLICSLVTSLFGLEAGAASNAEFRLLGGVRHVNSWESHFGMNEYLGAEGLPTIAKLPNFTLELGSDNGRLGGGLRLNFSKLHLGDNATGPIENYSKVYGVTLGPQFRFFFIDHELVRFDVNGGVGLSWGNVATRKNGQEAIIEEGLGWAAWFGPSISLGWRFLYVVVEGGYLYNPMDGLRHKVDDKKGIHYIDLSGFYVQTGLAFAFGDRIMGGGGGSAAK